MSNQTTPEPDYAKVVFPDFVADDKVFHIVPFAIPADEEDDIQLLIVLTWINSTSRRRLTDDYTDTYKGCMYMINKNGPTVIRKCTGRDYEILPEMPPGETPANAPKMQLREHAFFSAEVDNHQYLLHEDNEYETLLQKISPTIKVKITNKKAIRTIEKAMQFLQWNSNYLDVEFAGLGLIAGAIGGGPIGALTAAQKAWTIGSTCKKFLKIALATVKLQHDSEGNIVGIKLDLEGGIDRLLTEMTADQIFKIGNLQITKLLGKYAGYDAITKTIQTFIDAAKAKVAATESAKAAGKLYKTIANSKIKGVIKSEVSEIATYSDHLGFIYRLTKSKSIFNKRKYHF